MGLNSPSMKGAGSLKKSVIAIVLAAALLVLIMAGCGTGTAGVSAESKAAATTVKTEAQATEASADTTEVTEATEASADTTASVEAPSTPTLSDTIVLSAGWKIQQAISLEEMGKITGKEMAFYFYSLDKPAEGKPGGGYYIVDDPESANNQISIRVEVEGGQARYDSVKGYAVDEKTEDIAGIGDKAYLGQFDDAGVIFTTLAVLKGNLFFRVMVPTEVWKTLSYEPEQLASDIAYQLLENLYNPAREVPAAE
jgi:hypothetical protein